MVTGPDDKIQLEIEKLKIESEKLRLETRNLANPFARQPTVWLGLAGLLLSLGSNLVQYNSARQGEQLAEIKTQKLQLEATQLESQRAALQASIADQQAQLARVGEEIKTQQASLESLRTQLANTSTSRESALKAVAEIQDKTAILGGIVETTSSTLARSGGRTTPLVARDTAKAEQLERDAFQALVDKDFRGAQRLFQASEDAANGFRYSYEWARLLRSRASDLDTSQGQRDVLQFALSRGYASYAPEELRRRLREVAGG